MNTLKIKWGEVQIRQVPAYALAVVADRIQFPTVPVIEVETLAGKERVEVREGTPEYEAYRQEMDRAMREVNRQQTYFALSYGIVAWRRKGGKDWQKEPPKDWELDPMIVEIGGDTGNHRLNFIVYELLADPQDFRTVTEFLSGVRSEDVEAAEKLFRS